ncbi:hypothetical protein GW756_01750 [bacterium]|nr:hypothetical protein [bacterium]NCQ55079.1 hypothetical protein [Candidatus Parcubacteria bacterium]NCS67123.1 hypothetical protein [Candidatus Peregrinibacteria bacterium]NCS96069.1 hypothetical protein [bacterium]
MKISRSLGLMALSLSLLLTTFAASSAIADVESGQATDIVTSGNVIQVYTYIGASSEAGMMSTFNEGENWLDIAVTPKTTTTTNSTRVRGSRSISPYQKETPNSLYSRSNRTTAVTVESDYIKAIDECTALEDKIWDYRTDSCIDSY